MKKVLYGALTLVLVGLLGAIITINTSGAEAFTFSSVDVNEIQEIEAKNITKVKVDSDQVDVNILPTNGEKIEVEFSGKVGKKSKKLYKLDIEEDGDTVEIRMEKKNKFQFMMFNFTRVSLNIEVPQKLYDSLQINTASGDINVDEIEAKEVAIESQSGDMEVVNVVSEGSLLLKTSSGDVIANDNQGKVVEIKTSSGDIEERDSEAKEISLYSSSGDIETNYQITSTLNINTASGDIEVDTEEITGDLLLESSSGDVDVRIGKSPASLAVDFKSGSGDGKVNLDDLKFTEKTEKRIIGEIGSGKYKLHARTSSGDFTVN
ncbi:DUF4097 family beta strand repeat-containing protein [Fredinandcohnia humi]